MAEADADDCSQRIQLPGEEATRVWILEKLLFDHYGYTGMDRRAFTHERRARSAMRDDWHEEYVARGLRSPPEENIGPFETDTEATLVLPDGAGRIDWHIYETKLETEE